MENYCKTLMPSLILGMLFLSQINAQQKVQLTTNGHGFEHTARESNHPDPPNQSTCPDEPFRTIDGTCNNRSRQSRIDWGATDIALYRTMLPQYGSQDHYNAMGGEYRVSAREISNILCSQNGDLPSEANLSSFVFTWGQFIDHDIDLTPEGSTEYEPILLPSNEPLFTSDIHFFRSEVYGTTGQGDYRQQTNLITSYIDASNVYGSDEDRATWLRTFRNGKLKTSTGDLLPFNTIDGEYDSAIDSDAPSMAGDGGGTVKTFVAGDVRAAEQPGLTSLHTLFVRQHNRICDDLVRRGIRNDEEIYQRARKEVGAILQSITYNEFLPALGINLGTRGRYSDRMQADISNLFATAAYRLGHTMVTDELLLLNDQCEDVDDGVVSLLEGFFNPEVLREFNIAPILKGLSVQVQQEIDLKMIDNLRNFLFGNPSSGNAVGLDLASLNIQRGRDHGLPDYNSIRRHYTGRAARSFRDINRDRDINEALQEVYDDINEIDAWVGLLAEEKSRGSQFGPTLTAIITDQFRKLRDGDRYFFTHDRHLDRRDADRIDQIRLSDVIKSNTNLSSIQDDVFEARPCSNTIDSGNNDLRSSELNSQDLEMNVFPNPVSSILTIELSGLENTCDATILNTSGQVVLQSTMTQGINEVSMHSLPSGTYHLIVKGGSTFLSTTFVVVDK